MRHQHPIPLKAHYTSFSHSRKDIDKVIRMETEPLMLQKHFSVTSKTFKKNSTNHLPKTLSLDQELPPINPNKYAPVIKDDNFFILKPKNVSNKNLNRKVDINSQYLNTVSTSCNSLNSNTLNDFRRSTFSNNPMSNVLLSPPTKLLTNRKHSNMFLSKTLSLKNNICESTNVVPPTKFMVNDNNVNIKTTSNNNINHQIKSNNNSKGKNKKVFIKSKTLEASAKKKSGFRKNSNNSSKSFASEEDELKNEESILFKGFSFTQPGKIEDGSIKTNQDSFLIMNHIFDIDFNIYGVMDGHGSNGHLVSQYSKRCAMDYFSKEGNYLRKTRTNYYLSIDEQVVLKKLINNNYTFIKTFFNKTDADLSNQKFDVHFSGTTCVILFQIGKKLICANTGDSRCILIKSTLTEDYFYENLSIDHKPITENEKKRIESSGGVVAQCKEPNGELDGPFRVWVKGEEYPGLAVSRSLGDSVAESVGVISEPEIIVKDLDSTVKYIVLASDGVWDYLSGDDIIDIVTPFFLRGDPGNAAKEIVSEATKMWEKDGIERDDITVIVSFIGEPNKGKVVKKETF